MRGQGSLQQLLGKRIGSNKKSEDADVVMRGSHARLDSGGVCACSVLVAATAKKGTCRKDHRRSFTAIIVLNICIIVDCMFFHRYGAAGR